MGGKASLTHGYGSNCTHPSDGSVLPLERRDPYHSSNLNLPLFFTNIREDGEDPFNPKGDCITSLRSLHTGFLNTKANMALHSRGDLKFLYSVALLWVDSIAMDIS